MKINCIALLFVLMVVSCSRNMEQQENVVVLTEETMPEITYLEAEKIDLPEELFLKTKFVVYKDSILLAINDDMPNPTLLTMMNLNTRQVLGNYYSKGEGPGEVFAIYAHPDHNCLMVTDYPTARTSVFNIDSALIKLNDYKPELFYKESLNQLCYFTDSTLLAYNEWYAEDTNGFDTKGKTPELIVSDLKGNHSEIDVPENTVFNGCTGAYINANEKLKKIFCAYFRCPKYKIFDYDLNELKVMYGPDDWQNIEYGNVDEYNVGILNGLHDYAAVLASNDDYVFVYNERVVELPDFRTSEELNEKLIDAGIEKGELYQFDWDGNMLARYKIKDNAILKLSISEDSKTLYFTGYDEERTMCLYKVRLP